MSYNLPIYRNSAPGAHNLLYLAGKIVQYLRPDPNCPACAGTGTVYDLVPWGATNTQMPSECGCVEEQSDERAEEFFTNSKPLKRTGPVEIGVLNGKYLLSLDRYWAGGTLVALRDDRGNLSPNLSAWLETTPELPPDCFFALDSSWPKSFLVELIKQGVVIDTEVAAPEGHKCYRVTDTRLIALAPDIPGIIQAKAKRLTIGHYGNGSTMLFLTDMGKAPYCDISVLIPGMKFPPGVFYGSVVAEDIGFLRALVDLGYITHLPDYGPIDTLLERPAKAYRVTDKAWMEAKPLPAYAEGMGLKANVLFCNPQESDPGLVDYAQIVAQDKPEDRGGSHFYFPRNLQEFETLRERLGPSALKAAMGAALPQAPTHKSGLVPLDDYARLIGLGMGLGDGIKVGIQSPNFEYEGESLYLAYEPYNGQGVVLRARRVKDGALYHTISVLLESAPDLPPSVFYAVSDAGATTQITHELIAALFKQGKIVPEPSYPKRRFRSQEVAHAYRLLVTLPPATAPQQPRFFVKDGEVMELAIRPLERGGYEVVVLDSDGDLAVTLSEEDEYTPYMAPKVFYSADDPSPDLEEWLELLHSKKIIEGYGDYGPVGYKILVDLPTTAARPLFELDYAGDTLKFYPDTYPDGKFKLVAVSVDSLLPVREYEVSMAAPERLELTPGKFYGPVKPEGLLAHLIKHGRVMRLGGYEDTQGNPLIETYGLINDPALFEFDGEAMRLVCYKYANDNLMLRAERLEPGLAYEGLSIEVMPNNPLPPDVFYAHPYAQSAGYIRALEAQKKIEAWPGFAPMPAAGVGGTAWPYRVINLPPTRPLPKKEAPPQAQATRRPFTFMGQDFVLVVSNYAPLGGTAVDVQRANGAPYCELSAREVARPNLPRDLFYTKSNFYSLINALEVLGLIAPALEWPELDLADGAGVCRPYTLLREKPPSLREMRFFFRGNRGVLELGHYATANPHTKPLRVKVKTESGQHASDLSAFVEVDSYDLPPDGFYQDEGQMDLAKTLENLGFLKQLEGYPAKYNTRFTSVPYAVLGNHLASPTLLIDWPKFNHNGDNLSIMVGAYPEGGLIVAVEDARGYAHAISLDCLAEVHNLPRDVFAFWSTTDKRVDKLAVEKERNLLCRLLQLGKVVPAPEFNSKIISYIPGLVEVYRLNAPKRKDPVSLSPGPLDFHHQGKDYSIRPNQGGHGGLDMGSISVWFPDTLDLPGNVFYGSVGHSDAPLLGTLENLGFVKRLGHYPEKRVGSAYYAAFGLLGDNLKPTYPPIEFEYKSKKFSLVVGTYPNRFHVIAAKSEDDSAYSLSMAVNRLTNNSSLACFFWYDVADSDLGFEGVEEERGIFETLLQLGYIERVPRLDYVLEPEYHAGVFVAYELRPPLALDPEEAPQAEAKITPILKCPQCHRDGMAYLPAGPVMEEKRPEGHLKRYYRLECASCGGTVGEVHVAGCGCWSCEIPF